MSKVTEAMPSPMDRRRLKDRIVENVSKAVKQIQEVHFCAAGTTDLVFTNQEWQFCKLVEHLDHAFLHGLRHITNGYWVIVQEFTHKATVKEIKRLTNVTTNLGRGRAWLYLALMDHLLESYIRCFTSNTRLVKKYYVKEALVLDQQRMEILLTLAAGLEYMAFQLEVDVPYLDLSSHMRPRASSFRREVSDDQLSLCSMDSSMSQSSSMNTEGGHSALGELMETSSRSSSFEEQTTEPTTSTSSFAADAAPRFLVEDALQEETRERTERLSHISATVTTPDPMNPDDFEVIHVKAKLHRSKKKRLNKKKTAESDSERASVNSFTLNNPVTTPLTPDSCYRSGEENVSLDEAQKVFALEANANNGNTSADAVSGEELTSGLATVVGTKSDCDKPKCNSEELSKENCDNVCSRVCDSVENFIETCDRKSDVQTEHIADVRLSSENNAGMITAKGQNSSPNESKSVSVESSPKHSNNNNNTATDKTTDRTSVNSLPNADEDDLNTSISIYDSPKHYQQFTAEPGESLQSHVDHMNLATKESEEENLDLVKTPEQTDQPEVLNDKPEVENGTGSLNGTPSSSLTNNDSGCVDLDAQIAEGEIQEVKDDISPDVDSSTLVEDLEALEVTEEQMNNVDCVAGAAAETSTKSKVLNGQKIEGTNSVLIEDIASHNSPVKSFRTNNSLHHPAEIKVDNNLLLLMMLSIFKVDGEQFVKMYSTCLGHMEGEIEKVALLITSHAVYILTSVPGDLKYTVLSTIKFQHIDYLSLGLNYQSIQIVCTNRRNQFWITTGDSQLTRCIVGHLDIAMRESVLNLSNLTVLTDATTQKIALKKWVANECKIQPSEVCVACYVLGHWEDRQTDGVTIGANREGALMYKDHPSYMGLGAGKWKPGFFQLKNGVFYHYEDSSRSTPPLSCVKLNGEECLGCRRSPQGDRPYSFELVLSSGGSRQMAAASTTEQQEWLQSLCQAVSEGMGVPVPGGCLPSCIVVTTNKLLLCHEDTQTSFFRTLASANITDIVSQSTDPVPHHYVLLTFESCGKGGDCERWAFYFNAEDETRTFSRAVSAAWRKHFQVDLPRSEISDLSVLQHCREVLAKLST